MCQEILRAIPLPTRSARFGGVDWFYFELLPAIKKEEMQQSHAESKASFSRGSCIWD